MNTATAVGPKQATPEPSAPAIGCATCWAAKYCAAFSPLASPQPPPACPLVPKPAPRRRPRRPHLAQG